MTTRPEGDVASLELLGEVRRFLSAQHPELAGVEGSQGNPIVAASRLVQEDFCVLVRSDQWRLEAACVCFPSRWSLGEKIGGSLGEVHSPAPSYDVEIGGPVNEFFERLSSERSFWRLNWTLLDDPELHQPRAARRCEGADQNDWFLWV